MEELLEYLARSLVDSPDEVSVESFEEDDGTIVLELQVADDDAGAPAEEAAPADAPAEESDSA